MNRKDQHIIPKCYLKGWIDPICPHKQEYLWKISKNGLIKSKEHPIKTFVEKDMYTIKHPNGNRDLTIEDTLGHIETSFIKLMEHRINKKLPLYDDDRAQLCIFTAAMTTRVKSQQKNFQNFYRKIHKKVENLEKQHNANPNSSLETKILSENAHQVTIAQMLEIMPPLLYRMSLAILMTNDSLGFITSDHPCVLFNPELYKLPLFYRNPGLGQEKIEVTLPLSPHYMLMFSWSKSNGYLPIRQDLVDEFNRRTRAYCEEYFISNHCDTKSIWFDMGTMPEDA